MMSKEQKEMWFKYAKQYHLFGDEAEEKFELTKPVPVQTHRRDRIEKRQKEEEETRLRGQLSILDDYYEDEDEERRAKLEFLNTKIFGRPMFHGTPVLRYIEETGLGTLKVPYFTDVWETYYDDLVYLTTNLKLAKEYSEGFSEDILPQDRVAEFMEMAEQLKDSPPFEETLEKLDWDDDYKRAFFKFFASRITPKSYEKIKSLPDKQEGVLSVRPDLSKILPDEDLFAILTLYREDDWFWPDKKFVPKWLQEKANEIGIDPGFLAEYIILTVDELINTIIELIEYDTENSLQISLTNLKDYGPIEKLCIVLRKWALYIISGIRAEIDSYKEEEMEDDLAKYYSVISMGLDEKSARGFSTGQVDEYTLAASYMSKQILSELENDPLLESACSILSLTIKGSVAHPAIPKEKFEEHRIKRIE